MAIVTRLLSMKFDGDTQQAKLENIRLEYTDDSSGSFPTARLELSGTISGQGAFNLPKIDMSVDFDVVDTLADVYQRIAAAISTHRLFTAVADGTGVDITFESNIDGLNGETLAATLSTPAGLTITSQTFSGGVEVTPTGSFSLDFDGSYQTRNIHADYNSAVQQDLTTYTGKTRSELTIPTPLEVFTDYDAQGNVTQVQLLF